MSRIIDQISELVNRHYTELEQKKINESSDSVFLSEPYFNSEEAMNAIRTILGGWISQGPNVKSFEDRYSSYIGTKHGIAVNSGSSANLVALSALKKCYNIPDGAEVIVPAATFATVSMPIIQVGLVPVYVDVCRSSLNIDPEEVKKAINEKTRILMPVHTLGYPAPMSDLMELAKKYKLIVFEDCCEAHGSKIKEKKWEVSRIFPHFLFL